MLSLFSSCTGPQEDNFIGKWNVEKGQTIIKIKEDHSFYTEQFTITNPDNKVDVVTGSGTWNLVRRNNSFRIELIFYEPISIAKSYYDSNENRIKIQYHSEHLFVKGFYFFGLSSTWYLYQVIDRPTGEKWVVFSKSKQKE